MRCATSPNAGAIQADLAWGELSFGPGSPHDQHAEIGTLTDSAIAVVTGGTLPAVRNTRCKKPCLADAAVDKLDAS